MFRQVLVVCIGNLCRSPVAAALLRHHLPGLSVQSAGTDAVVGEGAHPYMVQLMQAQGLDLSSHRAQQLTPLLMDQSDLILVMDHDQKQHVLQLNPEQQGRVFRWAEFQRADVPDPMGQTMEVFEQVMQQIQAGAMSWQTAIQNAGYHRTDSAT